MEHIKYSQENQNQKKKIANESGIWGPSMVKYAKNIVSNELNFKTISFQHKH